MRSRWSAALALMLPTLALGNAPPPEIQEVYQPDGTPIRVVYRASGLGVVVEDPRGYPLIGTSTPLGTEWTWATAVDGELFSTGVRADRVDPELLDLEKHPELVPFTLESTPPLPIDLELTPPGAPALPQARFARPLVVLVRFPGGLPSGQSGQKYSRAQFGDLFFAKDLSPSRTGLPSGYRTSLRDWFDDVSGGALSITAATSDVTGWVTAPERYDYYVAGRQGYGSAPRNSKGLAKDVVRLIDPSVDLSAYDGDGDGAVDVMILVVEGWMSGSSDEFWPHFWTLDGVGGDGVVVDKYLVVPEQFAVTRSSFTAQGYQRGSINPIGVVVHELGHAIGLPDLYDTTYTTSGIDDWGSMGTAMWRGPHNPPWFGAWTRVRLGWTDPIEVPPGGFTATLPPASSGGSVYRTWIDPYREFEYFLFENRQAVGGDALVPGSGMVAWHIDERIADRYPSRNDVNSGSTFGVAVEQADGLDELRRGGDADSGDPFPGSTSKRSFTQSTSPNTRANDGTDSDIRVTGISTSSKDVTATFEVPDPLGYAIANDRFTASRGFCVRSGGSCASRSHGAVKLRVSESGEAARVHLWTNRVSGKSYTVRLHAAGSDGLPGAELWRRTHSVSGDGWSRVYVDKTVRLSAGDEVFVVVESSGSPLFADPYARSSGRSYGSSNGSTWTRLGADLNVRLTVESSGDDSCPDADGDGWTVCAGDCDDADPKVNPGATERCDGVDQDCDGRVDEGFTDTDGDGVADCVDDDDDGDGVRDTRDTDPKDPYVCQDLDNDGCDDCAVHGEPRPDDDGLDTDGDGICDVGDPDDDGDGVLDIHDTDPKDPYVCQDLDGDGCDDCAVHGEPRPDDDGPDLDGDGLCDAGDPDIDGDGVLNDDDTDPTDPYVCQDLDDDGCDDCAVHGEPRPDDDGPDMDEDGICDDGDPIDDRDTDTDVDTDTDTDTDSDTDVDTDTDTDVDTDSDTDVDTDTDSDTDVDTDTEEEGSKGGSCSTTGSGLPVPLALLAGLLTVVRRRRA